MAIGLSFAHVLGDIFSVAEFMNMFGKVMNGGYNPSKQLNLARSLTKTHTDYTKGSSKDPLSVKRVDPVGDKWIAVNNSKMGTFSFKVNAEELSQIQTSMMGKKAEFDTFEVLCALIWQSIAKIRTKSSEPKMVTICKKWNNKVDGILSNSQMITVVKPDLISVVDSKPSELAGLIKNSIMECNNNNERKMVEEAMDKENGVADFVIYGGNLTFLNLEEANFYGFECKGQLPVSVSCFIDGVGDEGAVLVLPAAAGAGKNDGCSRIVTLILPENEVKELKSELKSIIY